MTSVALFSLFAVAVYGAGKGSDTLRFCPSFLAQILHCFWAQIRSAFDTSFLINFTLAFIVDFARNFSVHFTVATSPLNATRGGNTLFQKPTFYPHRTLFRFLHFPALFRNLHNSVVDKSVQNSLLVSKSGRTVSKSRNSVEIEPRVINTVFCV